MEGILDFIKESLIPIHGLSIHFTSDCNMACKYCYIEKRKHEMASYNREIRKALEDGSFVANAKKIFESKKDDFENIALWGAEPSINGDLFKNFIWEMLDYFTNVKEIMFSTNALLGGKFIYDNFYTPLLEYANKNHREIRFDLQLSLDGPEYINDDSRHPGATASTLETAYYFADNV